MLYYVSANKINIGDVLSNLGIRKLLLGFQGVNLYCDRPYVPITKKVIRKAHRDDIFIIGGGGLFMDYFMPFWNEVYMNMKRLRYILWGVGFCDPKRSDSWWKFWRKRLRTHNINKWKAIVEHSIVSSFRDENTYQQFKEISDTFKIGCPSINAILDYRRNVHRRLIIHTCHLGLLKPKEVTLIEEIVDNLAHKLGLKKVYVNRMLREVPLEKIIDLYNSAKITVSSGLHGCIEALCLGSKLIAISKDWKIEGFLEMVGLEEAICNINEIENRAKYLESQRDVFERIEKIIRENEDFAAKVRELIA